MTDRHVVAMRCPGRPKVPVILKHPPECHQTGDCEFGRTLAAMHRAGGGWVDGVYRQATPGGTGLERVSCFPQELGKFIETEAEYLRRLDEGPGPRVWPILVTVRSTFHGWRWTGRYSTLDGQTAQRTVRGVGWTRWTRWGRHGRERLEALFVSRHTALHGPPPADTPPIIRHRPASSPGGPTPAWTAHDRHR